MPTFCYGLITLIRATKEWIIQFSLHTLLSDIEKAPWIMDIPLHDGDHNIGTNKLCECPSR